MSVPKTLVGTSLIRRELLRVSTTRLVEGPPKERKRLNEEAAHVASNRRSWPNNIPEEELESSDITSYPRTCSNSCLYFLCF